MVANFFFLLWSIMVLKQLSFCLGCLLTCISAKLGCQRLVITCVNPYKHSLSSVHFKSPKVWKSCKVLFCHTDISSDCQHYQSGILQPLWMDSLVLKRSFQWDNDIRLPNSVNCDQTHSLGKRQLLYEVHSKNSWKTHITYKKNTYRFPNYFH